MKKKIRKKDLLNNILFAIIFFIIILINRYINNTSCNLLLMIYLDLISGILFFLCSFLKLKNFKELFRSIEFMYGISFFIYSIIGSIIFVLDNYIPRFYYFRISESIMAKTLSIYIYTFCFYSILCFGFNKIKYTDFDSIIEKSSKTQKLSRINFIIFDMIAILAIFMNLTKILKYGSSFFLLSTASKRSIINNGISHYINLFMIVYSLFLTFIMISKENWKKNKDIVLNIIIISLYWLITLTCERRMFVTFFIGFVFILLYKVKKIKIKDLLVFIFIIIFLLFSAALRDNISLKNHSLVDVIYSSTTEFYCTFMISDAYVANQHDLLYGKTYIVDSISKLFPRFILKNKSEDLSFQFAKEYNTNVGFAFNPVAEGILNFGKWAPIGVSIIMLIITSIARKLINKNILYYIVILTFVLDFCRGAFSNVFFDSIFCIVLIFLLFKVSKK